VSNTLHRRERLPLPQLRRGDRPRAVNETRGSVLADDVGLALDPWRRFRGLLGTTALEPGRGLLLRPCRQIHCWFMRYAIDALFLDADGVVVGIARALRPWRISRAYPRALATLELPAGAVERSGSTLGDRVVFIGQRCYPEAE